MGFFNFSYEGIEKFTSIQRQFAYDLKDADYYLTKKSSKLASPTETTQETDLLSTFTSTAGSLTKVVSDTIKDYPYADLENFSPNELVEAAVMVRTLIYQTKLQLQAAESGIFKTFLESALERLEKKQVLIANYIYENHLKPSTDKEISNEMKSKINLDNLPVKNFKTDITEIAKVNPLFAPDTLKSLSISDFMQQYTQIYSSERKKTEVIYVAAIDPTTIYATDNKEFETHLDNKIEGYQQTVIMVGTEAEAPITESSETVEDKSIKKPTESKEKIDSEKKPPVSKGFFDSLSEQISSGLHTATQTVQTATEKIIKPSSLSSQSISPLEKVENLTTHLKGILDKESITFDSFQINKEPEKLLASKAFLLYAQMHKIAKENPGKPIVYEYFGDFTEDKTAHELVKLFGDNLQLIPEGMMLRFTDAKTKAFIDTKLIMGTGIINEDYQKTVEKGLKSKTEPLAWLINQSTIFIKLDKLKINSIEELLDSTGIRGGVDIIKVILQTNLQSTENPLLISEGEKLYQATLLFIESAINPLFAEEISAESANHINEACKSYIATINTLSSIEDKKTATDLHKKTTALLEKQLKKQENEKRQLLLNEVKELKKNYSGLLLKNEQLKTLVSSVKMNWPEEGEEFEEERYQIIFDKVETIKSEIISIEEKLENIGYENIKILLNLAQDQQKNIVGLINEIKEEHRFLTIPEITFNLNKYAKKLEELSIWLEESERSIKEIKEMGSLDGTIVNSLENQLETYRKDHQSRITRCDEYITKLDNYSPEEIEKIKSDTNTNLESIKSIENTFREFDNLISKKLILAREELPRFQKKLREEKKFENNLTIFKEKIEIAGKKCLQMNSLEAILPSKGQREEFSEEFNNYHNIRNELNNLTKRMELLLKEQDTHPRSLENLEKQNQEILNITSNVENLTNSISLDNIQKSCQKKIDNIEEKTEELGKQKEICERWISETDKEQTENNQAFEQVKTEVLQLLNELNSEITKKEIPQKSKNTYSYILDLIDQWTNPLIKFIQGIIPEEILQFFKSKEPEPNKASLDSIFIFKKELEKFMENITNNEPFNIPIILETLRLYYNNAIDPKEKLSLTSYIKKLTEFKELTAQLTNEKNELEKTYLARKAELQGIESELDEATKSLLKLLNTKANIQDSINVIISGSQPKPENLPSHLDTNQSDKENISETIHTFLQSRSHFVSSFFTSPPPEKPADTSEKSEKKATSAEDESKKPTTPHH